MSFEYFNNPNQEEEPEEIFESSTPYDKNGWKKDFIDENGKIHGIVIAKSYEAKKYGIKTGTQLRDALKMCPKLFIVHSDHLFYQQLEDFQGTA